MADRYWINKPGTGEDIETTFHDIANWGTSGTSGPGSPAPTTGDVAIFFTTQAYESTLIVNINEPILCAVRLILNCGNLDFRLNSVWSLLNDFGPPSGMGGILSLTDPSAIFTSNNYNMSLRSLYLNYGKAYLGTSTINFVYYEGVAP